MIIYIDSYKYQRADKILILIYVCNKGINEKEKSDEFDDLLNRRIRFTFQSAV